MEMNVMAVCIVAKDLGSVLSTDNTRRVAVPYQLLFAQTLQYFETNSGL